VQLTSHPELLSLHPQDPGKYLNLPGVKAVNSLSAFAVIAHALSQSGRF
jgi:hypothetical protein